MTGRFVILHTHTHKTPNPKPMLITKQIHKLWTAFCLKSEQYKITAILYNFNYIYSEVIPTKFKKYKAPTLKTCILYMIY